MSLTLDEAERESAEIIGRGISAATEILRLKGRSPEEMLKLSQELADSLIRSAEKIAHVKKPSATCEFFAPSENMKPAVLSVSEILRDYNENPVAADKKYEGNIITIRGKVATILEDSKYADRVAFCVILEGDIHCYFHRKCESDIITLKAGNVAAHGRKHSYRSKI